MNDPQFDLAAAHRHFAAACFNGVWDLIDKSNRSPDEGRMMVSMAHASLFHWQQRPDCSPRNLSIGYWQLSRVYALVNEADNAKKAAQVCLTLSQNEPPFYIGFAYEALARAEHLSGNLAAAAEHLSMARTLATQVEDASERQMLEADLTTILT